jgi:hypothetical protein
MRKLEKLDLLEDFRDRPLNEEWTAVLTLVALFEFLVLNACYFVGCLLIGIPMACLKWWWRKL